MTTRIVTAAAALAAAVAVSAVIARYRQLHRVLARERVEHRLMDGCLHHDMDELHRRIGEVLAGGQAGRPVDEELAAHAADLHNPHCSYDPYQEGGPS